MNILEGGWHILDLHRPSIYARGLLIIAPRMGELHESHARLLSSTIIRASSDVTLPSPLTSQRRSDGRLPTAIWSAITASVVVNAGSSSGAGRREGFWSRTGRTPRNHPTTISTLSLCHAYMGELFCLRWCA